MPPCRNCGRIHDAYASCARKATAGVGPDHHLVGKVLGERYRVGEILGSGTSGIVFAAEHLTFARPAAIKVVRARHATPELASRVFSGDAIASWSLAHPSLCEVFDIGTLPDGTPFFVMERLEGETLAARIGRERLSLAAGIDMMMQLLSAVVALHARDLLLRDLRPNNIFLVHRRGCRPLVKLLDIGLGRLAPIDRLQEHWTATGPQPGAHPHYLSPERMRGEHLVEVASDIFVAGAIFYEALAGERAFNGASWRAIADQIARGEPTPLHDRRGDIPVELSQFLSRSMSANPRTRPTTAKDMQDELRAIFEDARKASVSIYAPPPGVAPVTKRPSASRIAAEPYADETETRRSPRTRALDAPPISVAGPSSTSPQLPPLPHVPLVPLAPAPPMEPHPAEEMDQTLERLDSPATRKAIALAAAAEEDETQTTKMSAELRARIDQLMQPPPSAGRDKKSR